MIVDLENRTNKLVNAVVAENITNKNIKHSKCSVLYNIGNTYYSVCSSLIIIYDSDAVSFYSYFVLSSNKYCSFIVMAAFQDILLAFALVYQHILFCKFATYVLYQILHMIPYTFNMHVRTLASCTLP